MHGLVLYQNLDITIVKHLTVPSFYGFNPPKIDMLSITFVRRCQCHSHHCHLIPLLLLIVLRNMYQSIP